MFIETTTSLIVGNIALRWSADPGLLALLKTFGSSGARVGCG